MTDTNDYDLAVLDEDLTAEVARYIAECCNTFGPIHGKFFKSWAEVREDGYITVHIERINFGQPNDIVQTLLHPTKPEIVPSDDESPRERPAGIGSIDLPPNGDAA